MDPTRKILIADDAAMFRELGALFLARSARVVTATNGFEALAYVRRERPSVVVADLDMPNMGGDELCRAIKADPQLEHIPVILVTSGELAEDRARAVRAGSDDVIAKPISRIMLIQAVNRFLRGHHVRGLARVPCETRVHIVHDRRDLWGVARNLSRGGIFIETDLPWPPDTEVALEFRLPDTEVECLPTAQVVWTRNPGDGGPAGVGLQFLALDRESAAEIDAYVYERAPAPGTASNARAAAGGSG